MSTQTAPPAASIERHRSPRLYIVILVILCVLFVAGYLQRLSTLDEIQRQVAAMHDSVAASEQRGANLKEEVGKVQDLDYLALMARDDMGLVQEGDLPVVIYDAPPAAQTPESHSVTSTQPLEKPIWQQWLDLLLPGSTR